MCGVLKAARRPPAKEWGTYGLDVDGRRRLHALALKLNQHLYFEHRARKDLLEELHSAVVHYRKLLQQSPRPRPKDFAAEVLDRMAQSPSTWVAYLGLHHIDLPTGTSVGEVNFVRLDEEEGLAEAWSHFGEKNPSLLCNVAVVAGTPDLALARARKAAENALALIRQKVLYGFMAKMYRDQVAFGLDGTYAWKIGDGFPQVGWWRAQDYPVHTDLSAQHEWASSLAELSDRREALPRKVRERVDTCLDWLDVAARTGNWRIMLPAVFSAMEALLVPENAGRKAGAVTVRRVAVHVALEEGFFHPREIVEGYFWRSKLVHGTPTHEVNETELTDLAEDRQRWAFRVLCDYLRLAATEGFENVEKLVAYLDAGPAKDACQWLHEHSGDEIVEEYREMLHSQHQ
jgi:hypothetical protein